MEKFPKKIDRRTFDQWVLYVELMETGDTVTTAYGVLLKTGAHSFRLVDKRRDSQERLQAFCDREPRHELR